MLSRSLRPLYLLLVVFCVVFAQPKVPPSIIKGPPANGTYFTDDPGSRLELSCSATGNPPPTYRWTHERNGQVRDVGSTSTFTRGSTSDPPGRSDEGIYQCFVWNEVGKAMSNKTNAMFVRRAVFSDQQSATPYQATIGDKLKLDCLPSFAGVPPPQYYHYSWEQSGGTKWQLDGRVQIDDDGNLNIADVRQEDIDDQRVWKCKIRNAIYDVDAGGSESKIVSSGQPPVSVPKPQIMFYTNQSSNHGGSSTVVVGLEGQSVSLRCFFSGSGRVTVAWSRADGISIPATSRFERRDETIRLQISELERNDEAEYVCTGSIGTVSSDPFRLQLLVHVVPTFKQMSDRPHDYNTTVGSDVEFQCNAYAIPDASVVWYKNGEKIDPNSQSSKFQFSGDRKTLTIRSVCKENCGAGGNDLMVIQCNASNQHGYALANGYINVFEPTTLVMIPDDVTANFPDPATFTVKATSDPDTAVTYTWYRYDEESSCVNKWCVIHHVANKTHITTNNGSSLTIYNTGVQDVGRYRCVATNGVDRVTHEVKLIPPYVIEESKLWPFWWVPLLIILLILIILIIILCCCWWMRRNRGDEYPVDEKERAADRDPEKELADSGFHDYQRQPTLAT